MPMTLASYLHAQFSAAQEAEFLLRLLAAGLCGGIIGLERSRRLKEAGLRTHVIVCCTAALMMIISKYGFVDLIAPDGTDFPGVRGADSARIAAQVVSGVSFLGAGAIFKSGNTIKGLTTAAGIWATAGIGLALGAGMYVLGIASTLVQIVLQTLMHRFTFGVESMVSHYLSFTMGADRGFRDVFNQYMEEHKIQVTDSDLTYTSDGLVTCNMILKTPHTISIYDVDQFLHEHCDLKKISYSNFT
ncbi:MAG: MgtC/SapB family protein [Oscillibacter sp.]|nr:MgtC/SapB family protein [Oscillibacter sp.]